jgi:hypothetical protein
VSIAMQAVLPSIVTQVINGVDNSGNWRIG